MFFLKKKIENKVKQPMMLLFFSCKNLYYYLRGCSCLDRIFFLFQNTSTPLGLSREKIKG